MECARWPLPGRAGAGPWGGLVGIIVRSYMYFSLYVERRSALRLRVAEIRENVIARIGPSDTHTASG